MGGIEMDISLNSGEYVWNGNSNNSYPDIELIRGFTYYISIDVTDNHPVRIQSDESFSGTLYEGLSHSDNTIGTNAENKSSGIWTWQRDLIHLIFFIIGENHSAMKGKFVIVNGKGSQGFTGFQGFTGYGPQGFTDFRIY